MRKTTKGIVSIAATITLATSFTTANAEAAHVVKSGDTLWKISQQYNISVSKLQSVNGISGHVIYPGQKIQTSSTTKSSKSTSSSAHTYTVKSGDTLSHIGRNYKVSVSQLKSWNNLSSDLILVGQKLKIKESSVAASTSVENEVKTISASTASASGSAIVNEARKHVGTPYAWGGSSPGGFDCSGFIAYVFNKTGNSISRTSAASYYNQSAKISSPKPGDLVFFSGTYKAGISHMGIYAGNNTFIHASSSGVQITSLSNSYWSKYFTGFGRIQL